MKNQNKNSKAKEQTPRSNAASAEALNPLDMVAEACGMSLQALSELVNRTKNLFVTVSGNRFIISDSNGNQLNWR